MANLYCSSVFYGRVAQWAASTTYAVGAIVRQLATQSFGNERCFRCITAGVSGTSEPGWDRGRNGQTQDNSARWQECTGQEAYQGTDGNWRAPHAHLNALTNNWNNGDYAFVDYQHRMLYTGSNGYGISGKGDNGNPNYIYSVDPAVSFPPTYNSLRVGAREQTADGNLSFSNSFGEVYGLTAISGNGTAFNYLTVGFNNNAFAFFNKCTLGVGSTGVNGYVNSSSGSGIKTVYKDLSLYFAHNSQTLGIGNSTDFSGLKLADGSVMPVRGLFTFNNGNNAICNVEASDLSFMGTNPIFNADGYSSAYLCRLIRCKLAANAQVIANLNGFGMPVVDLIGCDSGTVFNRIERYSYMGTQVADRVVVRTGGSADLRQAMSYKVLSLPGQVPMGPFEAMSLAAVITAPGSYTLTVEGLWDGTALPTQTDIYARVGYQSDTASTLGTLATTERPTRWHPTSAYAASTEAWDSKVPVRANSTAYATGALVSLKSNPGRVFVCTSAGNSAGSEPAGFASAVDGSTVTDGNATFRALVRFKIAVPIPNAQLGVADVVLKFAKPGTTCWFDFVPVLT